MVQIVVAALLLMSFMTFFAYSSVFSLEETTLNARSSMQLLDSYKYKVRNMTNADHGKLRLGDDQ